MNIFRSLALFFSLISFLSANILNDTDKEKITNHFNSYLDRGNIPNVSILIKLKNPLPGNYSINDSLWIVKLLEDPVSFTVSVTSSFLKNIR